MMSCRKRSQTMRSPFHLLVVMSTLTHSFAPTQHPPPRRATQRRAVEPTVGVDLPARLAIERVLRALAEEGMAILMTSHDLEEMGRLCDRVAFLDAGRLVAEGSPASLIHDVFADRREWQVTLDALPDDELAETLAGLGLQPEDPNAPLQWRGLVGAIDVDALDALPAIEWRVRRPGLDSLWHRLFGRPPEAPS